MKHPILRALATMLLLSAAAHPVAAGEGPGTRAFEFARLPAEPAGRSLAGAHVAAVEGPASVAWNPAGLGRRPEAAVLLSHASWVAGTSWEWGALVVPLPSGGGSLALGCGVLRSGPLEGYDVDGAPAGEFTPLQLAATFGWGRRIAGPLALGVALEYAAEGESSEETQQAWAGAAGVQIDLDRLQLGCAAMHLAPKVDAGDEAFPTPASVRVGASYAIGSVLKVHAAGEKVAAQPLGGLAGVEVRVVESATLYGGLRHEPEDPETQTRVSCGIGIEVGPVRVTYGFQPDNALESTHQVSLGLPLTGGR